MVSLGSPPLMGVTMIIGQNVAIRTAIDPQTLTTASSVSGNVLDCAGFDFMSLALTSKIASGISTITLSFGDTTDPTDVYRRIGAVGNDSVTIQGATASQPSSGEQRVFLIDLRTRPRYCRLAITGFSMNGGVAALAFFTQLGESNYTNTGIAGTGGEVLQG